jgi:hypothetical protein
MREVGENNLATGAGIALVFLQFALMCVKITQSLLKPVAR